MESTASVTPASPMPPLPCRGLRVLLVEDNPVYRCTAQRMLEQAGAIVATAENGVQGVERALAGGFDLLLMDVQMPVLDGLAAARAIRADPRGAKLPIIAMTGDDSATAQAASAAVGIDLHLGKALEPAQLLAALQPFFPADLASRPAPPPRADALDGSDGDEPDLALPELPGIDLAAALRRNPGDAARLRRYLNMFRLDSAPAPAAIQRALAAGRPAEVFQLTHTLKSSAAQIGAVTLAELATTVAQLARANNTAALPAPVDRLVQEHARVMSGLEQLAAHLAGAARRPPGSPPQLSTAIALCRVLLPLLQSGNTGAWEVLDTLERLLDGSPHSARLALVAEQFDELELETAAMTLTTLLAELEAAPEDPT